MVSSIGGTVGETWTFAYDDQGRVTNADLDSEYGIDAQFVWSDDVIIVNNSSNRITLNAILDR